MASGSATDDPKKTYRAVIKPALLTDNHNAIAPAGEWCLG
jgi:hypothetical protein